MVDSASPSYVRRERGVPLSFTTKLYQGIGAIPETVKNWTFNTFILLYYNQILGLDAKRVSVALAIALVFDAVTDPLVAAWSDNLATRWGRRHPLMFAGAVPLGCAMYAVFAPWPGLGDTGLFVWLLVFVMLTRGLMTLYFVPWAAIAAELSDDYDERTKVMSYRYAVGWTIGVSFPLFVYTFILPTTAAHPVGQLNPTGYPLLALAAGVLMTGGALATTLLTRREIPFLRQHAVTPPRFSFAGAAQELWRALQNRQFALVFVIVLSISAIAGTTANLHIYMATYFWGLNTSQLRWFSLASVGAIAAFPLVATAQSRWDKRSIFLTCSVVSLLGEVLVVSLRFLDVLPENGDPRLLAILVAALTFGAAIAVIHGIVGASVVADVLDDHELRTGYRQEAMFNAALSFSGKAVSGVGIVIGGMILDLVALPHGAAPGDVPAATIQRLGWIVGIDVPLLYLVPIALTTRYRLTRAVHAEIRRALDERRAADGTGT